MAERSTSRAGFDPSPDISRTGMQFDRLPWMSRAWHSNPHSTRSRLAGGCKCSGSRWPRAVPRCCWQSLPFHFQQITAGATGPQSNQGAERERQAPAECNANGIHSIPILFHLSEGLYF